MLLDERMPGCCKGFWMPILMPPCLSLPKTSGCCLQVPKLTWRGVQLRDRLRTPSGGSAPAFGVQSSLRRRTCPHELPRCLLVPEVLVLVAEGLPGTPLRYPK